MRVYGIIFLCGARVRWGDTPNQRNHDFLLRLALVMVAMTTLVKDAKSCKKSGPCTYALKIHRAQKGGRSGACPDKG